MMSLRISIKHLQHCLDPCCFDKILVNHFQMMSDRIFTTMKWIFNNQKFGTFTDFLLMKKSNRELPEIKVYIYFDDATMLEGKEKSFAVRKTLKCVDETSPRPKFSRTNLDIFYLVIRRNLCSLFLGIIKFFLQQLRVVGRVSVVYVAAGINSPQQTLLKRL